MSGQAAGKGFAGLVSTVLLAVAIFLDAGPAAASPDFKNLQNGVADDIEAHRIDGQWLVVMIWASDCEVCDREIESYQAFHDRHRETTARVLGVSVDGDSKLDDALQFIAGHEIRFANLIGEPETVVKYYQDLTGSRWIGTPTFLFFGPDGDIRAKQVGAVPPELVEEFIAANGVAQ